MADVREMRIFSAEQIVVPEQLPEILKDFSKEVIRSNPPDIVKFSREYFTRKAAENKVKPKAAMWLKYSEHWRSYTISVKKTDKQKTTSPHVLTAALVNSIIFPN